MTHKARAQPGSHPGRACRDEGDRTLKLLLLKFLAKALGMDPLMAENALRLFRNDLVLEKRTTWKEKLWAYRRGVISGRIPDYRLDEANHRDYLSDWAYFRLFPLNGTGYSDWIDDKLTTRQVLDKYRQYLPACYFSIRKGTVQPSLDQTGEGLAALLRVIQEKGPLAFKKAAGSFGKGFYKVAAGDGGYLVNDRTFTAEELAEFVRTLDGYLVTEFIRPHPAIATIYPKAANAIRLMVIKEEDQPAFLANAIIRFATDQSGGRDNAATGIIAAVLDPLTGAYEKGCLITAEGLRQVDHHPDTGSRIGGAIPGWPAMVELVLEMADYLDHLSWLGFDIVVTDSGFKLLEINSHQNIRSFQYFHPLLKGNPASDFLNGKLLRKAP